MGLRFRHRGLVEYQQAITDMEAYNAKRMPESDDEIWMLEHPEIITLGISTKEGQVHENNKYPVVKTRRGGQATAHNPGQLVVYFLYDLRSNGKTIREFVGLLQNSIIALLSYFDLKAHCIADKPGVYLNDEKIASIGLRVSNGHTSHGIGININNNLDIFSFIYPCGQPLLKVTSLKQRGISTTLEHTSQLLSKIISNEL